MQELVGVVRLVPVLSRYLLTSMTMVVTMAESSTTPPNTPSAMIPPGHNTHGVIFCNNVS